LGHFYLPVTCRVSSESEAKDIHSVGERLKQSAQKSKKASRRERFASENQMSDASLSVTPSSGRCLGSPSLSAADIVGDAHRQNTDLPPEVEQGNVEYKVCVGLTSDYNALN
jgi:hypothetical protein